MCLYPKLIDNPKYKKTKKNGGNPPPIRDARTCYVPVGCGRCIECRKKKQRDWQVRLLEDIKTNTNGKFITLTFSDESIYELSKVIKIENKGYAFDNAIATLAVRRYLERHRKEYKHSLRHWFITELGHVNQQNIHIHGIAWYDNEEQFLTSDTIWQYGKVLKGTAKYWTPKIITYENYVNENTIGYITKYLTKQDKDHKEYNPIILTSAGIGKQYTTRTNAQTNAYNNKETKDYYTTKTGHKMSLPIYYRNKLYTEEQREQLWLNKLDEEKRYVLGQQIDISNGLIEYNNAITEARMKNIRLGYQDGATDKERKNYETAVRIIMNETRIKRGKGKKK
jgi:hypothetical protein